ncbi:MAG: hypothetical protein R3Y58_13195 [Eubacteriales bacterium]
MQKLKKPEYNISDIIDQCCSSFRGKNKVLNYDDERTYIVNQAETYDNLAKKNSLYDICIKRTPPDWWLNEARMLKMYNTKFVAFPPVRSQYYDQILTSELKCPICGIAEPSTLDHYLPKSEFPIFAVLPYNLVPMCSRCNGTKSITTFNNLLDMPLHAYYEDLDNTEWLKANILFKENIFNVEYVVSNELEDQTLYIRLTKHLALYELNSRLSKSAMFEIAENRLVWLDTKKEHGAEALKSLFKLMQKSTSSHRMNSWKSALYKALIDEKNIDIILHM